MPSSQWVWQGVSALSGSLQKEFLLFYDGAKARFPKRRTQESVWGLGRVKIFYEKALDCAQEAFRLDQREARTNVLEYFQNQLSELLDTRASQQRRRSKILTKKVHAEVSFCSPLYFCWKSAQLSEKNFPEESGTKVFFPSTKCCGAQMQKQSEGNTIQLYCVFSS